MKSLARHEGYVLLDNRASQGIPDEIMIAQGLPPGAGRGVYEGKCYTCNHCSKVVFINSLRVRERGYCRKCQHHICDGCEDKRVRTNECKPMPQIIDEALESALKSVK